MQRRQPQFASGEPGLRARARRWMRRYPVPLLVSAAFLLVLAGAFAASGGRDDAVGSVVGTSEPETAPVRTPCPVCGIGQRCDEQTARCVLDADDTPMPCAKGSKYDEEEDFCLPEPTPDPTPYPAKTLSPRATERPPPDETPSPPPLRTPSATASPSEKPDPTPSQSTPRAPTPTPDDE